MSFRRLLLRSALLCAVVCGGVALGVTYRRIVRAHWYFVVGVEALAIVAFVATEQRRA